MSAPPSRPGCGPLRSSYGGAIGDGPLTAPHPVVVDLPSETAITAVARAALRAIVESAPEVRLSAREVDEIAVVLQEACTNVIRHAHGHDRSLRFRVEFHRLDDALEIRIEDRGPAFELPVAAPDPEGLHEGGYGIHIMRSWMDEVSVTRLANGNLLRLVRRYRVAEGNDAAPAADRTEDSVVARA